jgi:hypothetical protein
MQFCLSWINQWINQIINLMLAGYITTMLGFCILATSSREGATLLATTDHRPPSRMNQEAYPRGRRLEEFVFSRKTFRCHFIPESGRRRRAAWHFSPSSFPRDGSLVGARLAVGHPIYKFKPSERQQRPKEGKSCGRRLTGGVL